MTEAAIRHAVADALRGIAPEADVERIPADANLRETLDIDSFDFLNFLIGLHERLGVEIPESDYAKLATMSDLVAYLRAK